MSQTQLQGTHCPQSWFYWPWDLKQDFPFISSSPEGSSHYNLFPVRVQVCPPRRNHCLRQPLNEDRSAWLSHCTLAKLSIVFVCWSTLSSPHVSILPSSQNRLVQCQRIYTQFACKQFVWPVFQELLWWESAVCSCFILGFINFAKQVDVVGFDSSLFPSEYG